MSGSLDLRSQQSDFLTSGASLLILLLGFQLESEIGWLACTAALTLISLWAWHGNYRRYRLVADLPTSRAASAPQGYIELHGRGEHLAGESLVSTLTGLPCLWFRYRIEEESDNRRRTIDAGQSDDTFVLRDSSGSMVIDPAGAEILTSHKQSWTRNDLHYTEWLLLPQDRLYVLGEHITLGGAASQLDHKQDVIDLLTQWKNDRPTLLQRFDHNKDGQIDLEEWEHARQAASREVSANHRALRQHSGVELMRQPRDGRLYLIANTSPQTLSARYRRWSWIHLGIFFAALGATAWQWL